MKKNELKNILKPLIKECIKEVMFEDGVLSGLVSEVAQGMSGVPTPAAMSNGPGAPDPTVERMKRNAFAKEQSAKLREHKSKLMSAIGDESYNGVNLFEGTVPAPPQASPAQQTSPLAGQPAGDPGVDITNLFGSVGNNWNAHMTDVKERK